MITELIVVFAFWFYLYVFATDVSNMNGSQLGKKLYYDLFADPGNYDHSLPMVLLIIEYFLNNIPFCWLHWIAIWLIHVIYVIF
jgi:hypothetical protein